MKMVMNGLLYDSEKATQIASYDNCLGAGDFNTRQGSSKTKLHKQQ